LSEPLGFIQLEHIPVVLLDIPATELHRLFPQPALLHIEGRRAEPLFVSVLLHGNETTGLAAVQSLLKRYAGKTWPRAVSIFFGNVQAARVGLRRLDGQPDFNRIWPGSELEDCPETRIAQAVYREMAARGVFASVDVHNNTGRNPAYSCVERLDAATLALAGLFDRLSIYSQTPRGTQTGAFAELCPSLTLECGQPGDQAGVEKAVGLIEACLNLATIADWSKATQAIDLFQVLAQVTVRDGVAYSFSDCGAELLLPDQLDRFNFTERAAGTVFGQLTGRTKDSPLPLIARAEDGLDVTAELFDLDDQGRVVLKQSVVPSMLTLDERVIRQDCLGYLMARMAV
jgi:hypothetical protein